MSISGTNEATQSVPFGTPVDTGDANAAGSAATAARSDHVHKGVVANAAWTSWTPTLTNLTQGSGTVTAKFQRVGRTIHWRFKFKFGSGSAVGTNPAFSLPVAPHADYVTLEDDGSLGSCSFRDAGTTVYPGQLRYDGSGEVQFRSIAANGSFGESAGLTATSPITWTTNDCLAASGTYEAAS